VKHTGVEWIGKGPLRPSTGNGIYARGGHARPTELCRRGTPRRLQRRLARGARPPTQARGKEGWVAAHVGARSEGGRAPRGVRPARDIERPRRRPGGPPLTSNPRAGIPRL